MKRFTKFFMAAVILFSVTPSWANVKLVSADFTTGTFFSTTYGYRQTLTRDVLVRVKNLGYDKTLTIWSEKEDGSWDGFGSAEYLGAADEGWELWQLQATTVDHPYDGFEWGDSADEFVIKYEVNGETYWDSNNSQNYSMCKNSGEGFEGALLGNDLNVLKYEDKLYYASCSGVAFAGTVTVNNIVMDKVVKVVYTTDNWATTESADLEYLEGPNAYGFEQWSFYVTLGISVERVEYAISYEVNGETFWDNNFGKNYVLEM